MEPILVCGVGMMTSVGLTAAETAASIRAHVARFAETELRDRHINRFTLAEIEEKALPHVAEEDEGESGLTAREIRMLRIARMPLRECLAVLPANSPGVGICLALPESRTKRPVNGAKLLETLSAHSGGRIDARRSDVSHRGRAGGLAAIGQGVLAIQSGVADIILAGGIDSFRDLFVLGTLDLEQRAKTPNNPDGFIPGEAAAFVLLANSRAAGLYGLSVLGRVSSIAVGFEEGHLYSDIPYRGVGLAATITQLGSLGALEEPIAEVFSSMNGESYWAKEWGVGYLRNKAMFHPSYHLHHPADCLGDTGAACGALMVGLAALGIKAQYRSSPALVYGSSDYGQRAALVVSRYH